MVVSSKECEGFLYGLAVLVISMFFLHNLLAVLIGVFAGFAWYLFLESKSCIMTVFLTPLEYIQRCPKILLDTWQSLFQPPDKVITKMSTVKLRKS